MEINNHSINPDIWHLSDHASLIINIVITKEFIQDKWHTIVKNSKKEEKFISDIIHAITNINSLIIPNINSLELIVQEYTCTSEFIWYKHLKLPNDPKLGRIKSVKQNSESTDHLRKLKIRRHSKKLLKGQNKYFSTTRFMKLH